MALWVVLAPFKPGTGVLFLPASSSARSSSPQQNVAASGETEVT
jgi:hypothetical protein